MYEPYSGFYTQVVQNQTRRIRWSGNIKADGTTYNFSSEHIVAKSGKITNEISGSSMEIGTVYSSELDIGIYIDDIGVPRDKIYGAVIKINCTLTANNVTRTCPMGVFTVVEATQKGNVCSIVAYDNMLLFDAEFPITAGIAKPFDWLSQLCEDCNVTLANTQAEIEALPNGTYKLAMNWTDETNTYRDVLSQISAAVGCSAHINRDGELELYPLADKNSVATIRANDRYGSDIAHLQWRPNALYVTNKESGAVSSAGTGQLAFNLGNNAFLQEPGRSYDPLTRSYTQTHTVDGMLRNILAEAFYVQVVPIDAEIPLDPCLDLFDIVTLTGGQANNTKVLITALIHTIGGGTELKCAGANTSEETKASSRGSEGKREDWMWVSGSYNDSVKIANTTTQTWGDQLSKTWAEIKVFTWGDLLNGGGWVELENFQRFFSAEFTLGVIGLTTEYTCSVDTDVSFKLTIEKLESMDWVPVSQWVCTEHAIKGKHTTTLVSPFGILDHEADTMYKITAYMSGVDIVDSLKILTKEEIEELIGGGS